MQLSPRRMTVVDIVDPLPVDVTRSRTLDRGMAVFFPGPSSATGEDCLELHVHGSRAVVRRLLEILSTLDADRLRPAGRGEFTMRAVLNGKMDLVQAEALADLLQADTMQQAQLALVNMNVGADAAAIDSGTDRPMRPDRSAGAERVRQPESLSEHIQKWRGEILRLLAHVQAAIDFGEDEVSSVPADVVDRLIPFAEGIVRDLESSLATFHSCRVIREGSRVAIVGRPNAGKSSLINALAQRRVSIVSSQPGTTRDLVSVTVDLRGHRSELQDTAGIRSHTEDAVEQEGVRRAISAAAEADVVVLVLDVSEFLQLRAEGQSAVAIVMQLLRDCQVDTETSGNCLLVVSKVDVLQQTPVSSCFDMEELSAACRSSGITHGWMAVSTVSKDGLDQIPQRLADLVAASVNRQDVSDGSSPSSLMHREDGAVAMVTRERHRYHLHRAAVSLGQFLQLLRAGEGRQAPPLDLCSEELRHATSELSSVTRAPIGVEDVLDAVFSEFCIGK